MDEYSAADEQDIDLTLRDRARTELLAFTSYTKEDYQIGWHHRALAKKLDDFIDGKVRYLMVFMPPRHGKSELVSRRLPALLHGRYPDCEIMAASYLDSLAGELTTDVQNIIDSKEYQELFPGTKIFPSGTAYSKGKRNSTEHDIVGHKGKYRGQGVGGSFTGKGANFIIIDDPIKGREIADSVAFRERLWDFYNNDLFSRLETDLTSGKRGQVLLTQTRWHEDDLAGRITELMKEDPAAAQFEIIHYPAIRVDGDDLTDRRNVGEALWPQKYDLRQLAEIKATAGPRAWSSLYQQNPIPDGGGLFTEGMFAFVQLPEKFHWTFTTADTAYSEKKENDFTVFSVWGVIDKDLFLLDVFRKQMKAADVEMHVQPFLSRFLQYRYRGTYIEPKGHGIYLNQKWKHSGLMIPSEERLKEFYADRKFDKMERANNAVPHLANRQVFINKALANKEELVAECLFFPKGKHDDFVDTVVDAVKIVHTRKVSILQVLG